MVRCKARRSKKRLLYGQFTSIINDADLQETGLQEALSLCVAPCLQHPWSGCSTNSVRKPNFKNGNPLDSIQLCQNEQRTAVGVTAVKFGGLPEI